MLYYLSVLAIFKNEKYVINEWIEHYINEGVEHFYLIDNGSDDGYNIKRLDKVDLVTDNTPYVLNIQSIRYNNHFLKKIKEESEWVIVVDLDEFMYIRKEFNKISTYLQRLPNTIEQIAVPWKMFGSSGLLEQPNSIFDFIYRCQSDKKIECKCIIRTKYLISFNIHCSYTVSNKMITTNNKTYDANPFIDISEKILNDSYIHLNHYALQSLNWFQRVKMLRGDADNKINVRDLNYFYKRNKCATFKDDELWKKRNSLHTS